MKPAGLTKKDQEWMAKWEKTRAKGSYRFILIFGVLIWGVSTGVLYAAMVAYAERGETGVPFWRLLWPGLALFPAGGIAWGAAMWFLNERAYKKQKAAENK